MPAVGFCLVLLHDGLCPSPSTPALCTAGRVDYKLLGLLSLPSPHFATGVLLHQCYVGSETRTQAQPQKTVRLQWPESPRPIGASLLLCVCSFGTG